MKTKFTCDELLEKRGCYSESDISNLLIKYGNKEIYSINEILNSDIPVTDKKWFVYNNCDLTLEEKKDLCLQLAWSVLPIYESKYPNNSRVKDCLQAIEDYKNGKITVEILIEKRRHAVAAYLAAYSAAATAAYAAYSAVATAAAYSTAATAAYTANVAAAAAYATYIVNDAACIKKTISILINFVK